MPTLDENTNGLQQILNTVNELPSGGGSVAQLDLTAMGIPAITAEGVMIANAGDIVLDAINELEKGRPIQLAFCVDGFPEKIIANASNAIKFEFFDQQVETFWVLTIHIGQALGWVNVEIELNENQEVHAIMY